MLQFDPDVFRLLAMFMPRSTCLCVLCHVFAQIYIPMLRSMCLCASCHAYMHRSMLVAMQCASKALLSLDISLSCVLALIGGVQIQILWARSTFTHLGLYQRVWIISFMHIYVYLLDSMFYIHVCLSRCRLCHALCPPWTCAYRFLEPLASMVTSIPPGLVWM